MKIEYLYDIIAIYNEKSIKNAARERGISERVLRQRIEGMEKEVGDTLFKINETSLKLTDEGKTFYIYAMKTLAEITAYKNEYLKSKYKKEITIGMDINVFLGSMYVCSDIVAEKYNVKFNVIQVYKNDVIEGVRSGIYDTGLIILDELTKEKMKEYSLYYKHICTRRPVVIVSENHPLANYKKVSLKKLENYNRISLKDSFEELYFFSNNSSKELRLNRSNMVYKYIGDVLLSLQYSKFYFIGGCNEEIDLGLKGLKVIEIEELTERVEVGCIYPKSKPFLESLKELIELNEKIKSTNKMVGSLKATLK